MKKELKKIIGLPTILVARGCLAPYFLEWWQNQNSPLHILDFSRWRWFEFKKLADPRWIGTGPSADQPVVLFDRNTTTGQTLRLLKIWLEEHGYKVIIVGHMDRKMGRLGLGYLDYVWDDDDGYDKFGLACKGKSGVQIVPISKYKKQVQGAYTFCVIGGKIDQLGGIDYSPEMIDLKNRPVKKNGSVIYQNVPSWEEAMILGYINKKPLVTIAGTHNITADYNYDNYREILSYIEEEKS
jgi:hypothetical protein